MERSSARTALALLLTVTGLLMLVSAPAQARPHRGSVPWSVILCKFSDRPAEPQTPQFFREFLTPDGLGMSGAADFWRDVSGGTIDLAGSAVRGWYTMPVTDGSWWRMPMTSCPG